MSIRSIPFYQSCHRAGEARGDPLGTSKRTATPDRLPSRHDGLPRPSLRSLLAMTKGVRCNRTAHVIPHTPCHREG